ncbi:MAG TPA: PQQ-binding-like beta-propeller repeat protein [Stellaceae bacterium]|nr:PQQ-binding-like beta-propeller repeat protein [Stellaceae bacterium]
MRPFLRAAFCAVGIAASMSLAGCDWISGLFQDTKQPLPGKRISVLSLDKPVAIDPKLESLRVSLPPPYVNSEWPDAGGYPSHAMYHLALNQTIKKVWDVDVGDGANDYGRVTAQPVEADGRVFAMDAMDVISAYDTTNGKRLWRLDPKPESAKDQTYGGGIAVAGKNVFVATGYGQILALDAATGKQIWRQNLSAPAHGAPTVADGRIFAVTVNNELEVLSADDGHQLWTHSGLPENASLLGAASPAVEGDIVVVPYSSGELFGLRIENGRVLWSDNLATARPLGALSGIADVRGQPVIDRDRVYAVSNSGLMVAIELRTGDRVWEQDIGSTHAPWAAGDFIYVLANDQDVVCLSRDDGKVRWVRELPRYVNEEKKKDPETWTGPVLAGDRLIVISSEGQALSISPYTGEPLGYMDFPDGVYVTPSVADKTLYVVTDEADLYALR